MLEEQEALIALAAVMVAMGAFSVYQNTGVDIAVEGEADIEYRRADIVALVVAAAVVL